MDCNKYIFIDADTWGKMLFEPVASMRVMLDVEVVLLINCNLHAILGVSKPVSVVMSSPVICTTNM